MSHSTSMNELDGMLHDNGNNNAGEDGCAECGDSVEAVVLMRNRGLCDKCGEYGKKTAGHRINGMKPLDHASYVLDKEIISKKVPLILKELAEAGSTEETIVHDFTIAMQAHPNLQKRKDMI